MVPTNRVGAAVSGAPAMGALGFVSVAGQPSQPPRLPDPVILEEISPAPTASRPPKPTDPGNAEPIRPCPADDWDDDCD